MTLSSSNLDVPRWWRASSSTSASSPGFLPPPDVKVLMGVGSLLGRDSRYFPSELLGQATARGATVSSGGDTRRPRTGSLSRWEEWAHRETTTNTATHGATLKRATSSGAAAATTNTGDDNDENDDLELEAEDDEEDMEDYTMNYYESEGDSDGDDAEATF